MTDRGRIKSRAEMHFLSTFPRPLALRASREWFVGSSRLAGESRGRKEVVCAESHFCEVDPPRLLIQLLAVSLKLLQTVVHGKVDSQDRLHTLFSFRNLPEPSHRVPPLPVAEPLRR